MSRTIVVVWPLLSLLAGTPALSQGRSDSNTTQAGKTWELGRATATPDKRDGYVENPMVLAYLQQLAEQAVAAAGTHHVRVAVTRSDQEFAALSPNRVLYISAELLDRLEDEAQLAGLVAHQLAHRDSDRSCVLGSPTLSSWPADQRGYEVQATASAILALRRAGYDPAAMLDMLSTLAYEHPAWAKAIHPDDLLNVRLTLEAEPIPRNGYRIDSSAFLQFRSALTATLRKASVDATVAERPGLRRRR